MLVHLGELPLDSRESGFYVLARYGALVVAHHATRSATPYSMHSSLVSHQSLRSQFFLTLALVRGLVAVPASAASLERWTKMSMMRASILLTHSTLSSISNDLPKVPKAARWMSTHASLPNVLVVPA